MTITSELDAMHDWRCLEDCETDRILRRSIGIYIPPCQWTQRWPDGSSATFMEWDGPAGGYADD